MLLNITVWRIQSEEWLRVQVFRDNYLALESHLLCSSLVKTNSQLSLFAYSYLFKLETLWSFPPHSLASLLFSTSLGNPSTETVWIYLPMSLGDQISYNPCSAMFFFSFYTTGPWFHNSAFWFIVVFCNSLCLLQREVFWWWVNIRLSCDYNNKCL